MPVSSVPFPGCGPGSRNVKGLQATVSGTFRSQLDELLRDLSKTHPRYIRCIKPNCRKASLDFDALDVLRQLRCAGMLESIRIRHAGFPVRRTFAEFVGKYQQIRPGGPHGDIMQSNSSTSSLKQICEEILAHFFEKSCSFHSGPEALCSGGFSKSVYQVGKTKVFLKESLQKFLDSELATVIRKYVTYLSSRWRGYVCRQRLADTKDAARSLQSWLRMATTRDRTRRELGVQDAAIGIQAAVRAAVASRRFVRKRKAAVEVQRWARGSAVRKRLGDIRRVSGEREAARHREKIEKVREETERRERTAKVEKEKQEMAKKVLELEKSLETKLNDDRAEKERREVAEKAEKERREVAEKAEKERREVAEKAETERREAEEEQRRKAARKSLWEEEENLKRRMVKLEEEEKRRMLKLEEEEKKRLFQLEKEEFRLKDVKLKEELAALEVWRKRVKELEDRLTAAELERDQKSAECDRLKIERSKQHLSDDIPLNEEDECRRLQREVSTLQLRLLSSSETALDRQRGDFEAKFREKDERIDEAMKTLDESKAKIAQLEARSAALEEMCEKAGDDERAKAGQLERDLRRVRERLAEAEAARDAGGVEINVLKADLESERERRTMIEDEKGKLVKQVKLLKNEIDVLKAKDRVTRSMNVDGPLRVGDIGIEVSNGTGRETIANQRQFLSILEQTRREESQKNPEEKIVLETEEIQNMVGGSDPNAVALRAKVQEKSKLVGERLAAYSDLLDEFENKKLENRRLVNEIGELKADKMKLEKRATNSVGVEEFQAAQRSLKELASEKARLEVSLRSAQKQKKLLEDTVAEMEESMQMKRSDMLEVAKKVRELESLVEKLQGKLKEASVETSSSACSLSPQKNYSNIEEVQSRYRELKAINLEFMDHMKTAQAALVKKTEQLRVVKQEKSMLEKQKEEIEERLALSLEEADGVRGKERYLEGKIKDQREELGRTREENKVLVAQESWYKIEVEKYRNMLEGVKERNQKLTLETTRAGVGELLEKTLGSSSEDCAPEN